MYPQKLAKQKIKIIISLTVCFMVEIFGRTDKSVLLMFTLSRKQNPKVQLHSKYSCDEILDRTDTVIELINVSVIRQTQIGFIIGLIRYSATLKE